MKTVRVSVVVPVLLPFPREGIDWLCCGTHRQLLGLSNRVALDREGRIPLTFRWLTTSATKKLRTDFFRFRHVRKFKVLEISFHIPHRASKYRVVLDDDECGHPDFVSEVASDVSLFLRTLTLSTNIARPGSMEFDRPVMFIEDEGPVRLPGMCNSLSIIFTFGKKLDWPEIRLLRLTKVWNWIKKIDDVWVAFGSSPIGRALAAFSHLHPEEWGYESPLNDLWSVIGLEAIYQSNGHQRELVQKACLFLGTHHKGKPTIEEAYRSRSGLIHGGVDFPFSYCEFDALPQFERWINRSLKLQDNSVPIFVATLQQMAARNIYSIEFEYKLKKTRAK